MIKMSCKILLLWLVSLLTACGVQSSKYIYNEGMVYGTLYHFVYESPDGKDLHEEMKAKLKEYNRTFSTFDTASVISKINRNEPVKLNALFLECYRRAMEISAITGGAFDITTGPLVNAWGFGPEQRKEMTEERIDSLRKITGFRKIQLTGGKIQKEDPGMKLDMSAIAKGYTCDLLAAFLQKKGCKNYMVEIGGEVVARGKNEQGRVWTIGISKPEETAFFNNSDLQAKVHLPGHALATSGNYRNYYVKNGKKYAHTIDPSTGRPVEHNLLSATVLAENCMDADAFATAFMVLGTKKSIRLAEKMPDIKVYFIYSGADGTNQIYFSENFKKHLVK